MKKMLVLIACLSILSARALQLDNDDVAVIQDRWTDIFDEQVALANTQSVYEEYQEYKTKLLAIGEDDIKAAELLCFRLCSGALWVNFCKSKDVATTTAYLEALIPVLQSHIGTNCTLRFPPQFLEFEGHLKQYEGNIEDFFTRTRQALLAFTMIVSQMNYIALQK